jgi:hypothetical protein
MITTSLGMTTTRTVAIARIDVLRVHAADLYAAPAIGEFFGCKCWHNQAESSFFGQWADVERAHAMLATVKYAMEQEFADFFETSTGAENPKELAANFSKGMANRISERLRRLKAGGSASVLARGKGFIGAFAHIFPRAPLIGARPSTRAIAYAAGIEAGNRVELVGRGSRRGMNS